MKVKHEAARRFQEIEAERERWSAEGPQSGKGSFACFLVARSRRAAFSGLGPRSVKAWGPCLTYTKRRRGGQQRPALLSPGPHSPSRGPYGSLHTTDEACAAMRYWPS
jgi:hypothetical protein